MRNDDFDEGFTLVTYNKRKNKHTIVKQKFALQEPTNAIDCNLPRETVLKYIQRARSHLKDSDFLIIAVEAVERSLGYTGHHKVDQIICYGLGKFSESVTSRYQLAFLLILRDKFQCPVLVYDPVFTPSEQLILPEVFNFELIRENEEGRRVASPDICTLIFAPHCPKQLSNNFLWANWSPNLRNCIFLCNSFQRVILNPSCLADSARYIIRILPHTNELILPNIFKFKDIFNDLAYHSFDTSKVDQEFWNKEPTPPVYSIEDTGILIPRHYVPSFKNIAPIAERDTENKLRKKSERITVSTSRDAAI